jgi:hypothetical protein
MACRWSSVILGVGLDPRIDRLFDTLYTTKRDDLASACPLLFESSKASWGGSGRGSTTGLARHSRSSYFAVPCDERQP